MKVTISVGGRFHAFNLANQLEKYGVLDTLITSYPKFEVVKYGIPREKIKTVILKEFLERGFSKIPSFLRVWNPQFCINEIFDKAASKKLSKMDIFVGWANQSLHSLKKAKRLGAVGIIERGSSHILYQNEILKEEYEKFGGDNLNPFSLPHPKIIEKELEEYERADYISIPSLFVKRTFIKKGIPEEKLIHVPYGVDISKFRKLSKEDEKFRVVFAGGMTLRKGVHYLLQAFSELNLPNSELMLIGTMNDEMKPFFKKYEGKFNYVGHVPQSELSKYYSQGSVFAIMSIEEGLALVQPQAMACGLPIIATTNTGAEDIVRDGKDGFIIPIRDIEKLKEKLLYLYENKQVCEDMGRSAINRVQSGFTWDDYGEKIIHEYERILSK